MKGIITGIGGSLLFFAIFPMFPASPVLGVILGMILTLVASVLVLAFWTGAVGVKWERD